MFEKKKCCRNCHFLKKYTGAANTGQTMSFSWNTKERENGKLAEYYTSECYHMM